MEVGCVWYLIMTWLHCFSQSYAGAWKERAAPRVRRLSVMANVLFVVAFLAQLELVGGRGPRLIVFEFLSLLPGVDVGSERLPIARGDLSVVMWNVAVWALPATAWGLLFRAGRQERRGTQMALCERCGYPLTDAGLCPECGNSVRI